MTPCLFRLKEKEVERLARVAQQAGSEGGKGCWPHMIHMVTCDLLY